MTRSRHQYWPIWLAICLRRSTRFSTGGWVMKMETKVPPRNGLTMNRLDEAGLPMRMGLRRFSTSSFCSALARWSGLPMIVAPDSSATYSRLREMASCTSNAAIGALALSRNTTGGANTASGAKALRNNTTGNSNTASGYLAGVTNTTGSNNTFVGAGSDAAANNLTNATAIGYNARVDASDKVRIGNSSITAIEGQVAWSYPSDARLKEAIRDLDLGLDFVLRLRPVAFRMKQGNGRTDMGFLAQDIEALIGDGYNLLGIGRDAERTLSLRATDLIAPLVKAVQDQHAVIESQQTRLERLEGELQALRAALVEQRREDSTAQ